MILETLLKLVQQGYRVHTDTRTLREGDIFFALKGPSFNANQMVAQAFEKGAQYAVVDEEIGNINAQCFLVDNVLKTLQELATRYRKTLDIPFIVVAGSNGKTSSKELIARVLSKKYKTFATPGNFNNHIGVPLSLLSIPPDTEMAVLEIGANHAREHELLCQIIQPNYGLITNNGKDHLEGFGSIEGVIKANHEVYEYFIQSKQGLVFVNASDDILMQNAHNIPQYTYGNHPGADIQGEITSLMGPVELSWHAKNMDKTEKVQTHMMGNYNIHNLLLAAAIGHYFKVEHVLINQALAEYKPANNRSQWIQHQGQSIILDAYNANPSSVLSALESLFQQKSAQRLILLGDMAELGAHTQKEHQNILEYILKHQTNQDLVMLLGSNYQAFEKQYPFKFYPEKKQALEDLKKHLTKSYLWLIKGSRSMKMEEVLYELFPELKN